jgi:hypothetical protein
MFSPNTFKTALEAKQSMTQSHVCTPGPWQIRQNQLWGGCSSDPSGAHFTLAIITYPQTNGDANAAMEANPQNPLAAAESLPDLVNILGQIVAAYDEYVTVDRAPKSLRLAITRARAILSKAKRP